LALKCLPQGMDGNPRVWFRALRDIQVGEELCFDYGGSDGTYWKDDDDFVNA
jgi:SET domain-containing protein